MHLVQAPHVSSYRHFMANAYAPNLLGWGYDNRFLPVRIPGGPGTDRRIEHRIAGADANPYLLTALLLQAALDGILSQMEAPDPIRGDPHHLGLPSVPRDIHTALAAFEASDWIRQTLPPLFFEAFINAKRQEVDRLMSHVSQFEIDIFRDRV